jgi:superfamily II DNA or RNA helicase
MTATIVIEGSDARLEGKFPKSPIIDATSYYKQGYKFMPRYKQGVWDGRIRLFNSFRNTFPAGLTHLVKGVLEDSGIRVSIDDRRSCPPLAPITKDTTLNGVSFDYPYDFQLDCMEEMVKSQRGVVAVATNGGKTEIAIATTSCLRLPTLFMVPGKELLYQTQKRYATRLGIDRSEVGLVGDGHWKPGQWITTAVVDSLFQNLKTDKGRELLGSTDVFFMDECHHAGADSWYKVARACPAYFRYGLSGTPLKRTDGADLRLLAATGPVLYEVRNKFLIERQISSEVEIQMLKMFYPKNIPERTPYPEVYKAGIVDNLHRNRALCLMAGEFAAKGLKVLMMVKEIRHGDVIDKRLWSYKAGSFTTHQFIHGKESTEVRQQALSDFEQGVNQVLIATSILDEGVDIPSIDVLILCGGGKSSIKSMQRLGRGIRFGGTGKLIVLDVADFQHRYLLDHSLQRLSDYKDEDCFTIKQIKLAA